MDGITSKPVSADEWYCSPCTPEDIKNEIMADIAPTDLAEELKKLTVKALKAQKSQQTLTVYDEEVGDRSKRDFRRSCILVSIKSPKVFNQFFNGRCGYRAMYWHAPEIGAEFNSFAVRCLVDALMQNAKVQRSPVFNALSLCSLKHQHAKIWPFFEETFTGKGHLVVPNRCAHARGNRIFDPAYPVFVVKGAFLNERGEEGPHKEHRSRQLHYTRFT